MILFKTKSTRFISANATQYEFITIYIVISSSPLNSSNSNKQFISLIWTQISIGWTESLGRGRRVRVRRRRPLAARNWCIAPHAPPNSACPRHNTGLNSEPIKMPINKALLLLRIVYDAKQRTFKQSSLRCWLYYLDPPGFWCL